MENHVRVAAVIPAAGIGQRMQLTQPKQYLRIGERTLLEHSVAAMRQDPRVEAIFIATAPNDPWLPQLNFGHSENLYFVDGGATRAASVYAGVRAAQAAGYQWVAVHDAARPCLQRDELTRVLDAGIRHADGALLAMPIADTIKRAAPAEPELSHESVPRDHLWRALTPQVFRTEQLLDAFDQFGLFHPQLTDEASAIERLGGRPKLVHGSATNIKVTHPGDETLAALFLTLNTKEQACE